MEALAKAGAFVLNALGVGLWVIIVAVLSIVLFFVGAVIANSIQDYKAKKKWKKIKEKHSNNVIDITHADKKWDK